MEPPSGRLRVDMSVAFSDHTLQTRKGPRNALVIAPTGPRVVDRARLERLRASSGQSEIEDAIIARIEAAAEPYALVVFRGCSEDGAGTWGYAPDLSEDEVQELSRLLIVSHLPTHRCMLRHGVYVMVHTDIAPCEAEALRRASQDLYEERSRGLQSSAAGSASADSDLWIFRHMNFYLALSFDKAMSSVLPDKLPLIELTRSHVFASGAQVTTGE